MDAYQDVDRNVSFWLFFIDLSVLSLGLLILVPSPQVVERIGIHRFVFSIGTLEALFYWRNRNLQDSMVDVIEQGARALMQPMARNFRNSQCCYGDSRNCHENVGLKNNCDSGQERELRLR
jgi:hypothetical protein